MTIKNYRKVFFVEMNSTLMTADGVFRRAVLTALTQILLLLLLLRNGELPQASTAADKL